MNNIKFYDNIALNLENVDNEIIEKLQQFLVDNNIGFGSVYDCVARIEAECYFANNEHLKDLFPENTDEEIIQALSDITEKELENVYSNIELYEISDWL